MHMLALNLVLSLVQPEPSPAAAVEQTVGITQLRVAYSRPAVAGRKVWGELVPNGEVWRAGANENTTLSATSAIKIAHKTLAAGTYGVHIVPSDKQWVVIFSHQSGAWGSYGYDPKEDALRINVAPKWTDKVEERLSYTFTDVTETSATLVLRWEKLELPVKIDVDTAAVVMAAMKAELRGIKQFEAKEWEQAARYFATHGGNLDEAAKMADRALATRDTYRALQTRALIAEKKGDQKGAAAYRAKADALATEADFNTLGYELIGEKKIDDAIKVFTKNVEANPASWNAIDSLAEAYMIKGDKAQALTHFKKALTLVKDDANKKRIESTIARLEKAT